MYTIVSNLYKLQLVMTGDGTRTGHPQSGLIHAAK